MGGCSSSAHDREDKQQQAGDTYQPSATSPSDVHLSLSALAVPAACSTSTGPGNKPAPSRPRPIDPTLMPGAYVAHDEQISPIRSVRDVREAYAKQRGSKAYAASENTPPAPSAPASTSAAAAAAAHAAPVSPASVTEQSAAEQSPKDSTPGGEGGGQAEHFQQQQQQQQPQWATAASPPAGESSALALAPAPPSHASVSARAGLVHTPELGALSSRSQVQGAARARLVVGHRMSASSPPQLPPAPSVAPPAPTDAEQATPEHTSPPYEQEAAAHMPQAQPVTVNPQPPPVPFHHSSTDAVPSPSPITTVPRGAPSPTPCAAESASAAPPPPVDFVPIPSMSRSEYQRLYSMYAEESPEYQQYKRVWIELNRRYYEEEVERSRSAGPGGRRRTTKSRSLYNRSEGGAHDAVTGSNTPTADIAHHRDEHSRDGSPPASPLPLPLPAFAARGDVLADAGTGALLVAEGTALCMLLECSRGSSVSGSPGGDAEASPIPGYRAFSSAPMPSRNIGHARAVSAQGLRDGSSGSGSMASESPAQFVRHALRTTRAAGSELEDGAGGAPPRWSPEPQLHAQPHSARGPAHARARSHSVTPGRLSPPLSAMRPFKPAAPAAGAAAAAADQRTTPSAGARSIATTTAPASGSTTAASSPAQQVTPAARASRLAIAASSRAAPAAARLVVTDAAGGAVAMQPMQAHTIIPHSPVPKSAGESAPARAAHSAEVLEEFI